MADNVTKEGQEFDSNSFVRFRGDFELLFQFPDSRISLVDIYFFNNPKIGYGLPPVKSEFSYNSLVLLLLYKFLLQITLISHKVMI